MQLSLPQLTITQASPNDLPVVMAILDEAAAWLVAKGIDQWPSPQPQGLWRKIERSIEASTVYVVYHEGHEEPIATLRLEWNDGYWPEDAELGGYIHSLAIRTAAHGQGIGKAIIEWAKMEVQARGRHYLRLDCLARNPNLCGYYEKLGFSRVRELVDRDYTAALYQMQV